jgi:replicative DNA helicase
MVRNALYDELEGTLRPEHFYVPLHAAVFAAVEHLINVVGVEANPISIDAQLKETTFGKQGNLYPHLSEMFTNAGFAGDIKSIAQVVQATYIQRMLMGLGDSIKREARLATSLEATTAVVTQAGEELYRLGDTGTAGTMRTAREGLQAMIDQAERARGAGGLIGVSTGFTDLDKLLGGLQRSDLIILGARPSMGKTSLLLNIAYQAARRRMAGDGGCAVGMFSLEMSLEQLMQRVVASAAGINSQLIANGHISEAMMGKLVNTAGGMADLPLVIDDGAGLTIQQIHSRARQMKRKYGIGLLVVDYLQLMRAPGRRNDQNRVQEVSEISQGLKQIARELDVPVLVASQLSRNVESRDNKRPLLSDLRESGSIEQDADLVMFLYREEYYLSRALGGASESDASTDAERRKLSEAKDRLEKMRGITELIVSKNRKGPTDTVRLLFKAETTCFHSLAAGGPGWKAT